MQQAHGRYLKFMAMIAASMAVMFFLMYLNSIQIFDHAWFSETRLFMTLIMGSGMMVVMILFMWGMYQNVAANIGILILAGILFASALWLVRSQATVTGVDYMEGMIPHHSIAVLTSERARIEDIRVRDLADRIIESQRKEIKQMEWLIDDIKTNGIADTAAKAHARPTPEFNAAPE